MTVVVIVCSVLLAAGAVAALVRVERGPSTLDRAVALDVLVATMIAGVGVFAAWHRRADVVPVLVVLSLVGFVGSTAIARFSAVDPEAEGRARTREEVATDAAAVYTARFADADEDDPVLGPERWGDGRVGPDDDTEHRGGGAVGEVR